jgi:hypothetical protein
MRGLKSPADASIWPLVERDVWGSSRGAEKIGREDVERG